MLDIEKTKTPETIAVGGRRYKIFTDFHHILRVIKILEDGIKDLAEIDFIYKAEKPENKTAGLKALLDFIYPPEPLPRRTGAECNVKVIDYWIDADYIYSAFMQVYRIDIMDTPLHWHKFCALLKNISGTQLNEITKYRTYENKTGEKTEYSKHMQNMRTAWELPHDEEPDEDLQQIERELYGE